MNHALLEEKSLRQANRELLERITLLEAERAQLDNTLAAISHDLKTPLTSIKLFADILLDHWDESGELNCDRYLTLVSSEAERMSRMITNIVDLQRLAGGRVEWLDEEHDIVRLVGACIKPVRQWCAAKGIGFVYESNIETLTMVVDASRFTRLLAGLLGNALRFTESGAIRVELRQHGEQLHLTVRDNGTGIAAERLHALAQPHAGGAAPCKDIGFTFASTVVAHHQGRIWAESNGGKGTAFHIELPLRRGGSGGDPKAAGV